MRFQHHSSISKPKRFYRRTIKVTFRLTRKDYYIAEFGKEIVKFYYKNIYKPKPPVFIPNKIDNLTQTSLFNLLCNTKKTAALIFVSALLFFLPIDLFPQSNNPKTITGKIENTQGKLWNNVLVELYENDNLLASDITENGEFVFENVITSIKDEEEVPTGYKLYQNYPNPFNPSTIINFTTPPHPSPYQGEGAREGFVSLRIYDILGREIKTLINQVLSPGEHSVTWNGTNNNGQGVSAGVYFYRLVTNGPSTGSGQGFVQTKKMILTDGVSSRSASSFIQSNNHPIIKRNSIKKTNLEGYYLIITGDSLLPTTIADLPIWQDNSFFDLGTLIAPGKPIVSGFVYDLDNKYDENNNRINPIPGLEGKKVFFGSDTANFTYTDSQGRFSLIADTTKTDSIFVTNTEGDSTHYNWRRTINLQPDEQEITAFNDTTGIPMFKQFVDSYGRDMLTYIFETIEPQINYTGTEWEGIISRIRDEDLPIKTYLRRNEDITGWYPDSSLVGIGAVESGRFQFIETIDSNQAIMPLRYESWFWPGGASSDYQEGWDENGPYLGLWGVAIAGPPSDEELPRGFVPHLVAHEIMHLAYTGGWHTEKPDDMLRSPWSRWNDGQPLRLNPIEAKTIKLIYDLERNSRLPDYFK